MVSTKKYVSEFSMMGTVISLTLFEDNSLVVNEIYDYLHDMNSKFSANMPDSQLSTINAQAATDNVVLDDKLYKLITDGISFSRAFTESFNIMIGPLVKLWKIGFGGDDIPNQKLIEKSLNLINPADVEINPNNMTVHFKKKGMQIDLGAIAKGYFADQIVLKLQSRGIQSGIINLGGNVKTFGLNSQNEDDLWNVGIQNPLASRGIKSVKVISHAKTFVTSGISERKFVLHGENYHHILSSITGFPVENDLAQVTIICDNSEYAEVISTVCFFKGVNQGLKFLNDNKMNHVEGIFIDKQGKIKATDGLILKEEGVYVL